MMPDLSSLVIQALWSRDEVHLDEIQSRALMETLQEILGPEIARLREERRRQFNPPQEVIEAWPEDSPWVAKYKGQSVGWDYFTNDLHLNCRSVDPRTLHHRSKFYPEDWT